MHPGFRLQQSFSGAVLGAAVAIVASAIAACAAQSVPTTSAGGGCLPSRPPRDAAVVSNHDVFAFVSPRSLPPSYTGCQVMWDESGNAQYVIRFANGELSEFSTYPAPSDTNKTVQVCRYANGKLLTAAPADCPSYDAVKGGIKTFPVSSEPPVPGTRDPRLRSP